VADGIRNDGGTFRAGLVKNPDDTFVSDDGGIIAAHRWRRWRLELLRVASRATTAILCRDDSGCMKEQVRLNWDSIDREPATLRAGIGFRPCRRNRSTRRAIAHKI
jgi:hypothetical protein